MKSITYNTPKFILLLHAICIYSNVHASLPGASTNKNYIITYAPRDPRNEIVLSENPHRLGATIQYFDGLGRPIQAIAYKQAPDQGNLVSFQEYDVLGRQPKDFLPFHQGAGTNVAYLTTPGTAQVNSYSTIHNVDRNHAFSLTDFENSPLNRVNSIRGPGKNWSDNNKKVNFEYGTNSSNEVRKFKINSSGSLSADGYYVSGRLYKTQQTDEDDKVSIEWKDMNGRVVKTKAGGGTLWAITYYVYDDFGLLRWVLPPNAVQGGQFSLTPESGVAKTLCYYYKYDSRKRLIEKHIPGADKIIYIYNSRDQLVLSQDGNQRAKSTKQWTAHHYDELGRLLYSAILNTNDSEAFLRDQSGANLNYVNSRITDSNKILENWYDTYPTGTLIPWTTSNFQSNTDYPTSRSLNTHGLLTASRSRAIFDNPVSTRIPEIYYYDDKGRLIQSIQRTGNSTSYLRKLYFYNWVGELLKEQINYFPTATSTNRSTLEYIRKYDHTGRLINDTIRFMRNGTIVSSVEPVYTYDKLGRLSSHRYHSPSTSLRTTYTYNVRSWLTILNHIQGSVPLLSQTYQYENGPTDYKSYSGNISLYMSSKYYGQDVRTYKYKYDKLNRLTNADFDPNNQHSTSYTYDLNGNILTLNRNGLIYGNYSYIDKLKYGYTGNQLKFVNNDVLYYLPPDSYKDNGSKTENDEFFYDKNGNMRRDDNKSLTALYNMLNLPCFVGRYDENNEREVTYYYTSRGIKFRELHLNYNTSSYNNLYYAGPFVFYNSTTEPAWVNMPHGRFVKNGSTWTKEIHLKDNLGNTRMAMLHNGSNYSIAQENFYYPFGGRISTLSTNPISLGNNKNRYMYNGKEFNDHMGLNWYDYGARFYDPQIARFHSVDPWAEKYTFQSPYVYAANNPILFIDYMGLGPGVPNTQFYIDVKGSFGPQIGGSITVAGIPLGFKLQGGVVEGSRRFYLQHNLETGWSVDTKGETKNKNYDVSGSAFIVSGRMVEEYGVTEHPAFSEAISEVQRLLVKEITTRTEEGQETEEVLILEVGGIKINLLLLGIEVSVGVEGRYVPTQVREETREERKEDDNEQR